MMHGTPYIFFGYIQNGGGVASRSSSQPQLPPKTLEPVALAKLNRTPQAPDQEAGAPPEGPPTDTPPKRAEAPTYRWR